MKITILTQYFPPEVGAPQNRLSELAVRFKKKGADISVITAIPNYPQMEIHKGYKGKFYFFEIINDIPVHRCWIFVSKSKSITKRLLNYFSFVFTSLIIGLFKIKKSDVLFVESPPLFLGISAYLLSRLKGAKLIFNVSDLWPESAEKLGLVRNRFLIKLSKHLEEFCYKKASLITGQTQGICENIRKRFPDKDIYWLKNGVDINYYNVKKQLDSNWRNDNGFLPDDIILIYAGILGYAQGLEIIIKTAKKLVENKKIKFVFLGSGPEKSKLINLKLENNLENVYFFEAVPKQKMLEILSSINGSIIPLKKLELFKGAIPSKIFENLALKKPIILGVDGEAKDLFINKGKCGLFFEPENVDDLVKQINYFVKNPGLLQKFGENGFEYVSKEFNRDIIANEFWQKINTIL
ncbi:MAG: glycosyltransferase family 4 protein [Bacteroidales bacterium]|nr:glycosyltransferase family 4 protein [Bacteroidales bacterium]